MNPPSPLHGSSTRGGGHVAIPTLTFLLAFGYFYLFHALGWFMEDEGVLYYQYLRVYHGQVPYRDFFTGYGPIVYYLHALAFALVGVSINALRVMMAIVNAATAAGLYVVARRLTTRSLALIPSALFVVMQPWDIAVMVFQNSPYPSWYALALAVWGTWAMLRWLEARRAGPGAARRAWLWLVAVGFIGGATFFSKQNAGTFFLWGVTGFLASDVQLPPGNHAREPLASHVLRAGYLLLIPLGALLLVRNFLGAPTVTAFVLPLVALAVIGARQGLGGRRWPWLRQLLWVALGALLATGPWLLYFAVQMGAGPFLNAILFLGAEVDRNLYLPFPRPTATTLAVLGVGAACALVLWGTARWHRHFSTLWQQRGVALALLLLALGCAGTGAARHVSVVKRVLQLEYNLWQIYAFTSERIDNLVAYVAVLVLGAAVFVAWRESPRRIPSGDPPATAFLCVLWIAACSFLLFYPRMDYAHLVGAVPLVYVLAAVLAGRARGALLRVLDAMHPRYVRLAFNLACAGSVLFVFALKSAPRVYSRVMVTGSPSGIHLVATPTEALDLHRAHLYFPIYLERQRLHLAALRDLITYVQRTTPPGEPLFAFPALPMVYFLTGHDNPTRHDYFLGDNVSFAEQLEVIRTLESQRVATVVRTNDPTDYFVAKSSDFTKLIQRYLDRRYYRERRFGPYDVLRRYGSPPSAPRTASRTH